MEQFAAMTGRSLKIYFRDRGAVFFSLLSMLIVIGLMVFFLGDINTEDIIKLLGQFPGRDAQADEKNAALLVLSWTCAGILSINAVTVTLAVYSVMIKDKVTGKLNSIYTAPVSRTAITAGYMAAAWIASVLVCTITLFITEIYGVIQGLEAFSAGTHLQLFSMIMINSFVYASLMYLIAVIAKTEGAWSGIGTVVGTLVGFLGGIYVPIGTLSATIGTVMKGTPVIYGTAMFRSVMMEGILDTAFMDIPEEVISEYRRIMGIDLVLFDRNIGITEELLLLFFSGMILLGVGVFVLKYGRRTDR